MSKVSIIIPTFNEERFIERCLLSIRDQSFRFDDMDIMVVDGNSTDKTRDIVLQLIERYPNIRLLDNPKKIQSAAFNIGVANSSAPFVVRLDAHAEYNKHYIERCLQGLNGHPETGDVGGIVIARPYREGLVPETNAIINKSRFGIGGAAFRVGTKAGYVDTVPFGAFRRHVIDEIGGMREDLARAEDNEYTSRIRKAGYKVLLDPEIISTYYARDTYKGLVRQMFLNGKSIGQLFYIDKTAIGLRHFVPLAFVSSLLWGILGGFIWRPIFILLIALLGVYILCALGATFILCKKYGWKFLITLPLFFISIHCSYGYGTILGLITTKLRRLH